MYLERDAVEIFEVLSNINEITFTCQKSQRGKGTHISKPGEVKTKLSGVLDATMGSEKICVCNLGELTL